MKRRPEPTKVAVAAFVLSALALVGAVVVAFQNIEIGEEVTKIEQNITRAPCVTKDLDDPNCVRQARRTILSCFGDKRCRRIIEAQRGKLRPEKDERKDTRQRRSSATPRGGGQSQTGTPPPSSSPPPSSGGGGGQGSGGSGGGGGSTPPPSQPPSQDTLLGPIIDTACEPLGSLNVC